MENSADRIYRSTVVNKSQRQNADLILLDILLLAANTAAFAVCWFSYYEKHLYLSFEGYGDYMVIGLFFALNAVFAHLYGAFELMTSRITELIYSNVIALLMTHFFMYMVTWMLVRNEVPNVIPLLLCLAACGGLSALWSYIAYRLTDKIIPPKRTLIVYDNEEAYKSGAKITRKYDNRFKVVGEAIATRPTPDIYHEIEEKNAEAVMLCGLASSQRNDILKYCIDHDVMAYVRPNIGDLIISEACSFRMDNLPVLLCQRAAPSLFYLALKRTMDILLSGVALIIASPFMLVTAIAIKAYDGGPVMFKQKRMTLDRKVFEIHKFRSMKVDADKGGKGIVTMQNDDRITPVGKVIRACRLDELPQLYDIFIGNMTIVGPRPERLETIELYEKEMPEFGMRLQVKAGLTGYAQVYGKANTSPYDKLQMDLMYIGEQSVITDLKIIFATIKILFMPESTEGFAEEKDALGTEKEEITV